MLRMTDNNSNAAAANENEFISIDQKRRQITFIESSSASSGGAATAATAAENANAASAIEGVPATPSASSSALDRAPMVSAPKIFAFDGLFTNADPQVSSLRVTLMMHGPSIPVPFDLWPPISQCHNYSHRATCARRPSRTLYPPFWTALMDAFSH